MDIPMLILYAFMFFILGFFSYCLFSLNKINKLYEDNKQLKIQNNRKEQVINFYKKESLSNKTNSKNKNK